MELSRAKGTRDFFPEDKIVRNDVVEILRSSFEKYGFNPLETPILERLDVLSSKYAGGAEILKETFKLKDQGGRKLGLRYDLTVPLARLIAMNKGLRMPFKRYAIGRVFRDGPLKLGRYREFWQCDVDVVGCNDFVAEVELMNMVKDVFRQLDVEVVIKVNDRRILDAVVESCGVSKSKITDVILVVDKLDKVGEDAVKKELVDSVGLDKKVCDELLEKMLFKGNNLEKLDYVEKVIGENEGLNNLKKISDDVDGLEFSLGLARGLAYYTGTVYEVFLKEPGKYGICSSLGAGGRYDELIGNLVGRDEKYPAVGMSFGLDVITDVLKIKSEKEEKTGKKSVVDVYVISIGCLDEAREIVKKFRNGGLRTDIDLLDRGISKNLDYASKAGIKYVVFVGKKELESKKIKLKDMETGKENFMTVNECFKFLGGQ
jgi:histidyl-tRNA synthetase